MPLGKKAKFETLRSIDSATFTGSYQNLGTPLVNPAVLLKLVNNSNQIVTVSYDGGAHDQDIAPAASFYLYDFGSDAQSVSGDLDLSFPAGTQIKVKGAAGVGLVYLVIVYQGL